MTLRTAVACAIVLGAVAASACSHGARDEARPAGASRGQSASQARIVSLAPSLTEIAYALGCGPRLVADTTYDDYPAAARSLPHVADLVDVDLERLRRLSPTAVIALHDQEREAAPIRSRLGVDVAFLPNRTLSDLFTDIEGVGSVCGMPTAARTLAASLRARIAAVAQRSSRLRPRPRVLFLLGLPGFSAGSGTFLDDLIRLAGGQNVAGAVTAPYPDLNAEALLQMDPEVIVVAREAQFSAAVRAQEPWRSMRAVKTGRVVSPPSDDILERNGPRIVLGLEWLASAIHPGK